MRLRVSKASFYRIVTAVTGQEGKIMTCVDYITGTLVNDSLRLITHIIQDLVPYQRVKDGLLCSRDLVMNFLKYHFDQHVRRADDCPTHNCAYALSAVTTEKSNVGDKITCNTCKFPFFLSIG